MKKKMVSVLLVGAMAASLLAGCGSGTGDETTADSTDSTAPALPAMSRTISKISTSRLTVPLQLL